VRQNPHPKLTALTVQPMHQGTAEGQHHSPSRSLVKLADVAGAQNVAPKGDAWHPFFY